MYKAFGKRMIELVIVLSVLFCIWPFLLFIAICVKLSSPGPVFFRQERGGKCGSWFRIFKFRTMRADLDAEKKGFEPGSDRRITAIGKILRKTKIDELPQVLNVILGDMALVGPRPEVRPYIELYPERWRKILKARPGITDPASIRFRNEEEILAAADDPEHEYRNAILPRKLELYEQYVEHISFREDVKIIFQTIFAVLLSGNCQNEE